MTVNVNDLVGRDYYEVRKRLVTRQNNDSAVLEDQTNLRTKKWEGSQATQGITKASVITEAKRTKQETGDKQNLYSVPQWAAG